MKKDPKILNSVKTSNGNGCSPEEAYFKNSIGETDPTNIIDLKCAQNISYIFRKSSRIEIATENEIEKLIKMVQEDTFARTIKILKDRYVTFNYKDYMIDDLKRFCVNGSSELNIDTTFDLIYGLWSTDTSYRNLSLINIDGKPLEFPGPSVWHFHKDRVEFRSFAAELVNLSPTLASLKKIGHDLDLATAERMEDILKEAKHLWCTQHLQARDRDQLHRMKASDIVISKIMADLYGLQNGLVIEHGLADAYYSKEFQVRLQSLKEVWNNLVPGFYNWFLRNHAPKFQECLTHIAQENLDINGRYYNNNIELKHRQQKKKLKDLNVTGDFRKVSSVLEKMDIRELL